MKPVVASGDISHYYTPLAYFLKQEIFMFQSYLLNYKSMWGRKFCVLVNEQPPESESLYIPSKTHIAQYREQTESPVIHA